MNSYIVELGHYHPKLELLVMGSLSLFSGLVYFMSQPETKGKSLPETTDDVLNLFKKEHINEEKSFDCKEPLKDDKMA